MAAKYAMNPQCILGGHHQCGGKMSHVGPCVCRCHGPLPVDVSCEICSAMFTIQNEDRLPHELIAGATVDCPECDSLLIIATLRNSKQAVKDRGHFLGTSMRAYLSKVYDKAMRDAEATTSHDDQN